MLLHTADSREDSVQSYTAIALYEMVCKVALTPTILPATYVAIETQKSDTH